MLQETFNYQMMSVEMQASLLVPLICDKKDLHSSFIPPTGGDSAQLALFSFLALNRPPVRVPVTPESLTAEMGSEAIFYSCRGLRRLLLGVRYCPITRQNPEQVKQWTQIRSLKGPDYSGPGLIMTDNLPVPVNCINTDQFLPVFRSLELTDLQLHLFPNQPLPRYRGIHCQTLTTMTPDYQTLFGIIMKFLTFEQFEECVAAFYGTISNDRATTITCNRNYFRLLAHVKPSSTVELPPYTLKARTELLEYSIRGFVLDYFIGPRLESIRTRILKNSHDARLRLAQLATIPSSEPIYSTDQQLMADQIMINTFIPRLKVTVLKKRPVSLTDFTMVIITNECSADGESQPYYLAYPRTLPVIYRLAMLMSVASIEDVKHENETKRQTPCQNHNLQNYFPGSDSARRLPGPPDRRGGRSVVSALRKTYFAPKDRLPITSSAFFHTFLRTLAENRLDRQRCQTHTGSECLFEMFTPVMHLSLTGFKITLFNTNTVINTKIATASPLAIHRNSTRTIYSLLDLPKITNNFVIRKYSVKEPSFTVSIFYSEDLSRGAAINVNMRGDLFTFIFAMNSLKCFLPIDYIAHPNVSNWNSTYDLQGLENQDLVRRGRRDLFWTTNFPSAVSSKEGVNISWFKAATATVSRIHGRALVNQIKEEVTPILTNPAACLDLLKNALFTTLEKRNNGQIQTLHKRFLESLVECTRFKGLDGKAIKKLGDIGTFDFSRRTVSHSKNKHEYALAGYRKCNLIPKILTRNKKVRLDELGRNANFNAMRDQIGLKLYPVNRRKAPR